MTVYIIIACFYALSSLLDIQMTAGNNQIKNRKIKCIIFLLPLFLIVALRAPTVGSDTHTYFSIFYRMQSVHDLSSAVRATSNMEPGYALANLVFYKIGVSYYFFQVIISLFIFFSLYRFFLKFSVNIPLSCLAFFGLRFMFGTMNQVRMWIAIAVLLFAFDYLIKRKILPFVLIVLLASTFHLTSFVFLLVYPLSYLPIKRKYVFLVLVGSIVLFGIGTPVFVMLTNAVGKYGNYITEERFSLSGNIAVYLSLLVDLIFISISISGRIWDNEKSIDSFSVLSMPYTKNGYLFSEAELSRIGSTLFWVAIMCIGLDIIGLNNNIMGRISSYFSSFMMITIPLSIRASKKNIVLKRAFVITLLIAQVFAILILRPDWYLVTPYKFFWQI